LLVLVSLPPLVALGVGLEARQQSIQVFVVLVLVLVVVLLSILSVVLVVEIDLPGWPSFTPLASS
jgi:uncharacterized membrane protein